MLVRLAGNKLYSPPRSFRIYFTSQRHVINVDLNTTCKDNTAVNYINVQHNKVSFPADSTEKLY
jgi:hypothetical protein